MSQDPGPPPAAEAERAALQLLRACATPAGFVAARDPVRNYHRVWSRDGVVCGLAALAAGERPLIDALEATLRTLARHQGRSGQLPSNVAPQQAPGGPGAEVSYGGKAGRVDATLWFILGVSLLGPAAGRWAALRELWPALERALQVVRAWEFNGRGLVYVPRAGDWADEDLLHGYVLYDQALRLWAWRAAAVAARGLGRDATADALREEAAAVERRVRGDFWPEARAAQPLYDPGVLRPHVDARRDHFLAAFEPGGADERFDALGNALCCLLGLARAERLPRVLGRARALLRHGLVPAFAPEVAPGDPGYAVLQATCAGAFRHQPGRYHNGGLWPMVNGFWVLAAHGAGDGALAGALTAGILRAAALEGYAFCEYLDGHTGQAAGVRGQAWSGAAVILATRPAAARALLQASSDDA